MADETELETAAETAAENKTEITEVLLEKAEELSEAAADAAPELPTEAEEAMDTEAETKAPGHQGSVAMSILAGLIGGFIGLLICTLAGGTGSNAGIILFMAIPVCIGLLNYLFRGSKGWPWLLITVLFSTLYLYLQPAFTEAARLASVKGISMVSVPLLAMTQVGKHNFISSFTPTLLGIFPILFILVGIFAVWAFLSPKKAAAPKAAEQESTETDPTKGTDPKDE